jgi:acyl-coenzyme A synthetase/AMP-(fatty) acid ligase
MPFDRGKEQAMNAAIGDPVPGAAERYNLIQDLLIRHAEEGRATAPALYFEDEVISYGELYRRVGATRPFLLANGIGRGDRVALVVRDSPAYVYIFLAAISLGAIPVGIDPNQNPADVPDKLARIGARCAFVYREESQHLAALAAAGQAVRVVPVDLRLADSGCDLTDLSSPVTDHEVTTAGDVLYLTFSSGTTGRAKAVVRRHRDILFCARSVAGGLVATGPEDRVMTVTKLTFGYSLVGGLMFTLLAGGALVVVAERIDGRSVMALARRYRPTILLAQPRIIAELNSGIEAGEGDWLQSLHTVMSAGDVLSAPVRDRWTRLSGLPITDGFGSVEAGHMFIGSKGGDLPAGALGRALPGYEIKLVDSDGREVEEGRPGRLCMRGNSVTSGYWNDAVRTRAAFEDGWYVSDDVFVRSGDFYHYAGRWDDMIKTGCGEWVSPVRIESVLRRDPRIADCAVAAVHDDQAVSRVKAFVVAADPASASGLDAEVRESVAKEWPRLDYMRVHLVEFVEAIPRSPNGKIMRSQLAG